MKSGIRLHQRATYVVCLLGMSLALMPLRTLAQAALPASFLSAGLTKALNRLGAKLDSQSSSSLGSGKLGFQGSFDPSGPSPVWSVTLSGDLDGNSPGRVIFSSDDQTSTFAPVTVVDANPAHEAHSLKFEVSVPRQVAFRSEDQAVKVFALELAAPEAGTAL